jgi:tRNA(Ile2) C34 agmatinyltransferase TiaS
VPSNKLKEEPIMLPGECSFQDKVVCPDCGVEMKLRVLSSAAGYYLGHACSSCGPWDRCTNFMKKEEAEKELDLVLKEGFVASLHIRR